MTRFLLHLAKPFLSEAERERIFSKPLTPDRLAAIRSAAYARVFGKPVVCSLCGKPLGKVICRVRYGRMDVLGLHEDVVRVDFYDRSTLRFRHARPESCKALQHR